jgi:hypothetical protein
VNCQSTGLSSMRRRWKMTTSACPGLGALRLRSRGSRRDEHVLHVAGRRGRGLHDDGPRGSVMRVRSAVSRSEPSRSAGAARGTVALRRSWASPGGRAGGTAGRSRGRVGGPGAVVPGWQALAVSSASCGSWCCSTAVRRLTPSVVGHRFRGCGVEANVGFSPCSSGRAGRRRGERASL